MRRYLLGQLRDADEERVELRLLTEPSFIEEFDAMVEEITDEYVGGELKPEERGRVEHYFLRSAERRNKAKVAAALNEIALAEKGEEPVETPARAEAKQTLTDRLRSFWNTQGFAFRSATALATLLVVAGLVFLIIPGRSGPQTYQSIQLAMTNSERGLSGETKRVKLAPETDGLRIVLNLPEESPPANKYRVESVDDKGAKRELEIVEQNAQSVTVIAPTSDFPPGRYGLQLSVLDANETPQRLPGTYRFDVE